MDASRNVQRPLLGGAEACFRRATAADVGAAWAIVRAARDGMLRAGQRQWTAAYPARADVEADVRAGRACVAESGGRVVAYGAVALGGEPAYDGLEGQWGTEGSYVVVHRLCVAPWARRSGWALRFLHEAEAFGRRAGAMALRIDTNFDNAPMLALLRRAGYAFRGKVRYGRGERLAFDKPLAPLPPAGR